MNTKDICNNCYKNHNNTCKENMRDKSMEYKETNCKTLIDMVKELNDKINNINKKVEEYN